MMHSHNFLVLLFMVFIAGIVLSSGLTPHRSRVRRQNMKVHISATEDTIVMKFLRPNANTKLEGYILGYGSSMFYKQFIQLPENGKPYENEFDAEPKYLIAVQPIPTNEVKKHCTGKVEMEKPLHLVIGSVTPTSVLLSWGTLLKTPTEGNIMDDCVEDGHYTVRYRERSRKWKYQTCPTSDTVVDHLKPNGVYEFSVQPHSKDGNGMWSKPVIHNISTGGGVDDVVRKIFKIKRPPTNIRVHQKSVSPVLHPFPFNQHLVLSNKTQGRPPVSRKTVPKTTLAPSTTTRQESVSTPGPTLPVVTKQPIGGGDLSRSVFPSFQEVTLASKLLAPLDITTTVAFVPVPQKNLEKYGPHPQLQQKPLTPPLSNPLLKPQNRPQLKPHVMDQSQPKPYSKTQSQALPKPKSQPTLQTKQKMTSHPTPQTKPQPQPISQTKPNSTFQLTRQTKPQPQPVSQAKPKSSLQPTPQTKPQPQPISQTKPNSTFQLTHQTKPQPQPVSQAKPKSSLKPTAQTKPQPTSQAKPQPKPKSQTKPKSTSQPTAQTQPRPQSQLKTQMKPQPQQTPQTQPQPKPKPKIQPIPQTLNLAQLQPTPPPKLDTRPISAESHPNLHLQIQTTLQFHSEPQPQPTRQPKRTQSQPQVEPILQPTPLAHPKIPKPTHQHLPHTQQELPKIHIWPQPQPQIQSTTRLQSQTQPQSKTTPEPKLNTELQSRPHPLPKSKIILSKHKPKPEPQSENQSKPQTPAQLEKQPKPQPKPQSQSPAKPQAQLVPHSEPIAQPHPPPKTLTQYQPENQSENQSKPQTPAQLEKQPEPHPKPQSQPPAKPQAQLVPHSEPIPQPHPPPKTPTQYQPEPLPKPNPVSRPQPRPQPGLHFQPHTKTYSGPTKVTPRQAVSTAPSPPDEGKPLPTPALATEKAGAGILRSSVTEVPYSPISSSVPPAGRNTTMSRPRIPPHSTRTGVRPVSPSKTFTSSHSSSTPGADGVSHKGIALPRPVMWSQEKSVLRPGIPVNKSPNLVGKPSDHDKPMDLKQGENESILKPFPLVTAKPKQERRQQTSTYAPALNSSRFDMFENSSIFRRMPASEVDITGKKRFVAPHVIYKTDKKPDEPCSITSSLTYFPDEEGSDLNVTGPPRIPPSNLTVVTVEGCPSFVILDWQKSDNETREYEVLSTTEGPNGQEVSILTTNQTHTAVENLKPESSYEFTVTPKNELGTGPSSDPVSFSTESADPRVSEYVSGKDAIWTQFPFKADAYSECNGKQYVKRTWYRKYVGVQICNSLRYKIYLSDSLKGKFYNIGDQTGYGEDHCQFVDSFLDGRTGTQLFAEQLPSKQGYFRALRQEPVNFGEIGGKSHVTYVGWYECGIPIPGKW